MLYKANFTRQNFSVKPHINQAIEVVFEHDEVTAGNIKELRKEAFKALYAQHPEAATVGHPSLDKPWVEWIMSIQFVMKYVT